MLKLTTSRWFTAKGRFVDGIGLKPDFLVDRPADDIKFYENPPQDTVVQRALEIIEAERL